MPRDTDRVLEAIRKNIGNMQVGQLLVGALRSMSPSEMMLGTYLVHLGDEDLANLIETWGKRDKGCSSAD